VVSPFKILLTLSLMLSCTAAWAETQEPTLAADAEPLRLRIEAALGTNSCINSDTGICSGWPTGFDSQNLGGFARVGATVFLPGPVDFLAGGLFLDIGGYGSGTRSASTSPSIDFQLAGLLRAFIPLEDEGFEFTVGLGFGLGHWSPGDGLSWTGLTIPVNLGLGYTVYEDIVIGGEVTFMPRLIGGAPHHFQGGIYVAYTMDLWLGDWAAESSDDSAP
jgi:hypothetical protein